MCKTKLHKNSHTSPLDMQNGVFVFGGIPLLVNFVISVFSFSDIGHIAHLVAINMVLFPYLK